MGTLRAVVITRVIDRLAVGKFLKSSQKENDSSVNKLSIQDLG